MCRESSTTLRHAGKFRTTHDALSRLSMAECQTLREALERCERATAGRCPATSKACDKLRKKFAACISRPATPPPATPPPPPPPPLPHQQQVAAERNAQSCSNVHCVVLDTALGHAFSWAKENHTREAARFGQLGWGAQVEKQGVTALTRKPLAVPAQAGRIIHVAAGTLHTAAVDENGGLWMCGSDRWRQLGQDAFWSKGHVWQREPKLVTSLKDSGIRIVQAACGKDHTIALDEHGKVHAFGYGEFGQLFGPERRPFTSSPAVSAPLSKEGGATAVWAAGHCSCARARSTGRWHCIGRCAEYKSALR